MGLSNTDKILLKISATAAMIFGIIYSFTIIGALLGIPVLIGAFYINSLIELNKELVKGQTKNIIIWSVLFLLTLNIVSVVLNVVVLVRVNKSNIINATVVEEEPTEVSEEVKEETKDEKIKKLQLLKEQGLLTEEEYQKLIDDLNQN